MRILPSETPTYGPPPFRSNARDSGPVIGDGSGNLARDTPTDGEQRRNVIKIAEKVITIVILDNIFLMMFYQCITQNLRIQW